jgi:hypothetical protein
MLASGNSANVCSNAAAGGYANANIVRLKKTGRL